jgi:lipopolysaccharide transport system permease protein
LATVAAAFADFLIALPLIPVLMVFYGVFPQSTILWLPFFVLHLLLLAAAFGIWFSILNTRFRDTANALPFLTQLWFFLSPIAYPARSIPAKWKFVAGLNPMLGLLEGFRWTLFGGNQPYLFLWVAGSLAITTLLLATGIPFFFASEAEFAELL